MGISAEDFINSVTQRARLAFMLSLGEKTVRILQDDPNVFSLARNLLDQSWSWEESLNVSPFEIFEYLESSSEDFDERETLSLVCQFDTKTPKPTLAAMLSSINAGSLAVMYACQVSGVRGGLIPDIIANLEEEEAIPGTVSLISETQLIDRLWIERAMSYLTKNYGTDNPNSLGEPIKREELMNLK
jgi:Immunity protein Imm6